MAVGTEFTHQDDLILDVLQHLLAKERLACVDQHRLAHLQNDLGVGLDVSCEHNLALQRVLDERQHLVQQRRVRSSRR